MNRMEGEIVNGGLVARVVSRDRKGDGDEGLQVG